MRGFLVMAMFVASLTSATWNDFNVEREFTADNRADDAIDFEEHFVKNSWRIDEVKDIPCPSRHVMSDTNHPVTDIT